MRVDQVADWLALMGDTIDAIPGVPGIGKKTATVLLAKFGDIDGLYASLDRLEEAPVRGVARLRQALLEHKEQVYLARSLTRLNDKALRLRSCKAFRYQRPKGAKLETCLRDIGCGDRWIASLLKDFENAWV
nr:5'-3' exonuclease H3TH domain-containing protein [Litorivivens lipolytica]